MEIPEYTIATLQTAFERGEQTAAGLTQGFLERISAIDSAGPTLASVIEVNPDAMAIAKGLDRERLPASGDRCWRH